MKYSQLKSLDNKKFNLNLTSICDTEFNKKLNSTTTIMGEQHEQQLEHQFLVQLS